ncbi:MAG: phosphoribosylanthranilate isomerase, partial [Desulforhopalus sp.]
VLLAGGLTPENIVQAIDEVKPFCVDVNSGVEIHPGVKDHQKLLQLMMRVAESGRR